MHMKQSPYQLHPQQFLSSSSSFYIMLHMCILWCVSNFFAYEKKTYSEKYEWESLLLLSELSISALLSHNILVFMFKNYIPQRILTISITLISRLCVRILTIGTALISRCVLGFSP